MPDETDDERAVWASVIQFCSTRVEHYVLHVDWRFDPILMDMKHFPRLTSFTLHMNAELVYPPAWNSGHGATILEGLSTLSLQTPPLPLSHFTLIVSVTEDIDCTSLEGNLRKTFLFQSPQWLGRLGDILGNQESLPKLESVRLLVEMLVDSEVPEVGSYTDHAAWRRLEATVKKSLAGLNKRGILEVRQFREGDL
ncbi:hypothetical protein CC2G_011009 [Coprinopsis cinerea AmutBmut pab1-1]|nr:hypothetical protein CC2G_011009 [Coprinopsis cinerea AmutBmut pab1-1]